MAAGEAAQNKAMDRMRRSAGNRMFELSINGALLLIGHLEHAGYETAFFFQDRRHRIERSVFFLLEVRSLEK
jgi:hypothetical protein